MRGIKKCRCGASAVDIAPAWFNNIQGYIVRCISKPCKEKTKQYERKGNAIRFWNLGYRA